MTSTKIKSKTHKPTNKQNLQGKYKVSNSVLISKLSSDYTYFLYAKVAVMTNMILDFKSMQKTDAAR